MGKLKAKALLSSRVICDMLTPGGKPENVQKKMKKKFFTDCTMYILQIKMSMYKNNMHNYITMLKLVQC